MHKDAWKSLSSKVVYENKWGRKIREHKIIRPTGEEGTFAVLELPLGVIILAINEKNEVYLIHQYRFPISRNSLELPAGCVDPGEEFLVAAKRELQEETGLQAKKWTEVGELYASTGSSNEYDKLFLAQDLTETKHHEQEEEGITELRKIKLDELLQMVKRNEIVDSATISSLLLASDHLGIGLKS